MNEERSGVLLDQVPAARRADAEAALRSVDAVGATGAPVVGGASGALVYRVDAGERPLLLRLEAAQDPVRDPRRTYPIMAAAAAAGVAPAVHHVDVAAGTVVMDLVDQRPLAEHPGGPAAVVAELGALVATLQAGPPASGLLDDFGAVLDAMLGTVVASGLFAPGVLDPVGAQFAVLRAAYPWDRDAQVPSHNDLNPANVLSDGRRLWLIDWELASANDRFNDIAIVANNLAATDELEQRLLAHWLHRQPEQMDAARLTVMRSLSRLFYGCLMLIVSTGRLPEEPDLVAPTMEDFLAALQRGEHSPTDPTTMHTLGKMQLVAFLADAADPALLDAIATTAG